MVNTQKVVAGACLTCFSFACSRPRWRSLQRCSDERIAMDQSSLTALLQQLQGLDPPPPPPNTSNAGEDAELEVKRIQEQDQPESDRQPAIESGAAPSLPESELERLLHSLRPLDGSQLHVPTHNSAQYTSYGSPHAETSAYYPSAPGEDRSTPLHAPEPATTVRTDVRKYTFAQALPVISRLAANSDFLEQLQQVSANDDSQLCSSSGRSACIRSRLHKRLSS